MRYRAPLFNRAISTFLFRVGLCSHGISLVQVTWPHRTRRIQARTIDCVDPSPRDHPSKHVLKKETKWIRSRAYLVTRGAARSVRSSSRFHHASVGVASSDGRDLSRFRDRGAPRGTSWRAGSPSDGRRKWIKEIMGQDSHDLARSDGRESTSFWLTVETCGSFQSVGSSLNRRQPWRNLIARSDRPPYLIRSDGSDQLCLTIVVHNRGSIGADLPWN